MALHRVLGFLDAASDGNQRDPHVNVKQNDILPTKNTKTQQLAFKELPMDEACDYVMDLIHKPTLSAEEARTVMRDVVDAWSDHVNPGFLAYRKSVADGGAYACIEWRDNHDDPHGATLLDAEGNEYIDCLGGFGIYNLGHSHPAVVAAVEAQLAKQPLHSQELLDPLRAYAAALLARTLPGAGDPDSDPEKALRFSFFTNSGAESVEHSLKFAMLSTGRRHFIGLIGAFHGKTVGALSGTSKAVFRAPFRDSLLPFTHVPPNDIAALTAVFEASEFTGNAIAGLIMEPVLGEGGIHVLTPEYLWAARALCDRYGAKLIFDEVQSGMGRCGGPGLWACQAAGVAPDIMAIGKAFGGGVMGAGAVVATRPVWQKFIDEPFLTTTTFGGNPLSMAASIATLTTLIKEGLPQQAGEKGEYMLARLRALQDRYPSILREVRGRGLMIGLEFPDNATGYAFARGVFARKIVISGTLVNARVIRVEPPLTISYPQLDTVLARFDAALAEMAADRSKPVPSMAPRATAAGGDGAGASEEEDEIADVPSPQSHAGFGAAALASAPATRTATTGTGCPPQAPALAAPAPRVPSLPGPLVVKSRSSSSSTVTVPGDSSSEGGGSARTTDRDGSGSGDETSRGGSPAASAPDSDSE